MQVFLLIDLYFPSFRQGAQSYEHTTWNKTLKTMWIRVMKITQSKRNRTKGLFVFTGGVFNGVQWVYVHSQYMHKHDHTHRHVHGNIYSFTYTYSHVHVHMDCIVQFHPIQYICSQLFWNCKLISIMLSHSWFLCSLIEGQSITICTGVYRYCWSHFPQTAGWLNLGMVINFAEYRTHDFSWTWFFASLYSTCGLQPRITKAANGLISIFA